MAGLGLIIAGLDAMPDEALRAAPRLRALRQRARALPACPPGHAAAIHAASGVHAALSGLAFGPVSALGEGGGDGTVASLARHGPVAMAEGVTLQVHSDHVSLGGPVQPPLPHADAAALVSAIDELWTQEGLRLVVGESGRWYLAGAHVVSLAGGLAGARCWQGMRLDTALAAASDRRQLARLLTETQMLLHEHPANRQREAQGQARVDSLWFSGAGVLPAPTECSARLLADEPYARGLMRLAGAPAEAAPANIAAVLSQLAGTDARDIWLYLPAEGCAPEDLSALERDWVAPAWLALARGRLGTLSWRDTSGRGGRLDRRGRLRLWARWHP